MPVIESNYIKEDTDIEHEDITQNVNSTISNKRSNRSHPVSNSMKNDDNMEQLCDRESERDIIGNSDSLNCVEPRLSVQHDSLLELDPDGNTDVELERIAQYFNSVSNKRSNGSHSLSNSMKNDNNMEQLRDRESELEIIGNSDSLNCFESPLFVQHTGPLELDPDAEPFQYSYPNEIYISCKDSLQKESDYSIDSNDLIYYGPPDRSLVLDEGPAESFNELYYSEENNSNDLQAVSYVSFNAHENCLCSEYGQYDMDYSTSMDPYMFLQNSVYTNNSSPEIPISNFQHVNTSELILQENVCYYDDIQCFERSPESISHQTDKMPHDLSFSICDIFNLPRTLLYKERLFNALSYLPHIAVHDIESTTALLKWSSPTSDKRDIRRCLRKRVFTYQVQLRKGTIDTYRTLSTGKTLHSHIRCLRPCTEYQVRLFVLYDAIKGDPMVVTFRTKASEPDKPEFPKLIEKTASSLKLAWGSPRLNGGDLMHYVLECDGISENPGYEIIYKGIENTFKVTQLNQERAYTFRLYAVNEVGCSKPSSAVSYQTLQVLPAPDAPWVCAITESSLQICWSKKTNDSKYYLLIEDEHSCCFRIIYSGKESEYTCSNLKPSTRYNFKLQFKNKTGQSLMSETISTQTSNGSMLPSPTILIGKIASNFIVVKWEMPCQFNKSENISFRLEGRINDLWVELYAGKEHEYKFDNLDPGKEYALRVACVTLNQKSEYAIVESIETPPILPSKCDALKASEIEFDKLRLDWKAPECDGGSNLTRYEILATCNDSSQQHKYPDSERSCIISLLPNKCYRLKIRACNSIGEGPWSKITEFQTKEEVPTAPKQLMVKNVTSTTASIQWERPESITHENFEYCVQIAPLCSNQNYSVIRPDSSTLNGSTTLAHLNFGNVYSGNKLYYELKDLLPNNKYACRVSAASSKAISPWTEKLVIETKPAPPSRPYDISCFSKCTSIRVRWKEPSNNGKAIISYNIEYGIVDQNVENEVTNVCSTSSNGTEITIYKLIPDTQYVFRVQALNGVGPGKFSNPATLSTIPLPPNPPVCELLNATSTSIKIKWRGISNRNINLDNYSSTTYTLEIENAKKSYQVIYSGKNHSFKVTKLLENQLYNFRISAANKGGKGPYSNVYTFKTNFALPLSLKSPPRIENINSRRYTITWRPIKNTERSVTMRYQVEMVQYTDSNPRVLRKIVESPEYHTEELALNTHYSVRVQGVLIADGREVYGHYSPALKFVTEVNQKTTETTITKDNPIALQGKVARVQNESWNFEYNAILRMIFLMVLAAAFANYSGYGS